MPKLQCQWAVPSIRQCSQDADVPTDSTYVLRSLPSMLTLTIEKVEERHLDADPASTSARVNTKKRPDDSQNSRLAINLGPISCFDRWICKKNRFAVGQRGGVRGCHGSNFGSCNIMYFLRRHQHQQRRLMGCRASASCAPRQSADWHPGPRRPAAGRSTQPSSPPARPCPPSCPSAP